MEKLYKKVAVIIPYYRDKLDSDERISLCQCRKVLNNYDRCFILPQKLRVDFIEDEKVLYVNPSLLSSRNKYSEFVLSNEFYELFADYEYVLIYQLDAFVFCDKLEYFCNLGYDYYGAKWPYGMEFHIEDHKLWYYGNGGFSLRKVQTFNKLIKDRKKTIDELKCFIPEDLIIAYIGQDYLNFATDSVADEFAFELNPEDSLARTNSVLPFGCHGWNRFGKEFWKAYIEKYGYTVTMNNFQTDKYAFLSDGRQRREKLLKYFDRNTLFDLLQKLISKFCGDIYVFGAGLYGLSFINMVKGTGINVLGIIDNDLEKVGHFVMKIEIIKLSDIKDIADIPVIITMHDPTTVIQQLESLGLQKGINYTTSNMLQTEFVTE